MKNHIHKNSRVGEDGKLRCSKCKKYFSKENFQKYNKLLDKRHSWCNKCRKEHMQEKRKAEIKKAFCLCGCNQEILTNNGRKYFNNACKTRDYRKRKENN